MVLIKAEQVGLPPWLQPPLKEIRSRFVQLENKLVVSSEMN